MACINAIVLMVSDYIDEDEEELDQDAKNDPLYAVDLNVSTDGLNIEGYVMIQDKKNTNSFHCSFASEKNLFQPRWYRHNSITCCIIKETFFPPKFQA